MTHLVTRAYNSWEIDDFRGVLKKSSTNSKIIDEMSYYEGIPSQFKIFFPRLVRSDFLGRTLELERYDYPNLGEYILGQTDYPLSSTEWNEVMAHLRRILDTWRAFPKNPITRSEDAYAMYISKTARGYTTLKEQQVFPEVFASDTLVINGTEYQNFDVS